MTNCRPRQDRGSDLTGGRGGGGGGRPGSGTDGGKPTAEIQRAEGDQTKGMEGREGPRPKRVGQQRGAATKGQKRGLDDDLCSADEEKPKPGVK